MKRIEHFFIFRLNKFEPCNKNLSFLNFLNYKFYGLSRLNREKFVKNLFRTYFHTEDIKIKILSSKLKYIYQGNFSIKPFTGHIGISLQKYFEWKAGITDFDLEKEICFILKKVVDDIPLSNNIKIFPKRFKLAKTIEKRIRALREKNLSDEDVAEIFFLKEVVWQAEKRGIYKDDLPEIDLTLARETSFIRNLISNIPADYFSKSKNATFYKKTLYIFAEQNDKLLLIDPDFIKETQNKVEIGEIKTILSTEKLSETINKGLFQLITSAAFLSYIFYKAKPVYITLIIPNLEKPVYTINLNSLFSLFKSFSEEYVIKLLKYLFLSN